MNLITTYYTPSNTERLNEIDLYIKKNIILKYLLRIFSCYSIIYFWIMFFKY
jgi:hypothetical protein